MNVTVSPASSAFIVIASSLPAHFNIFACEEFKIKPAKLVSQLHRTRPPRARAHHRARPRRSTQTIFFHRSTSTHPPRDVTRRHTRAASRAPTANRERPDRAWNRLAPRACAPRRPFDGRRSTHHICQVHPHRQRAIASVVLEAIGVKLERDPTRRGSNPWLGVLKPSTGSASKLASVTRSLTESRTFLSTAPCLILASNMVAVGGGV